MPNKTRSARTNPMGKTLTDKPTNGLLNNASATYLGDKYPASVGPGDIQTEYERKGLNAESKSNVVRSLREMGKAPKVSGSSALTGTNRTRKLGMPLQFGQKKGR